MTIPLPINESVMNTGNSALQCRHVIRSTRAGEMAASASQFRHLKCIIRSMKPLVVILLLALSVQGQSLADAARKERERRSKLPPARVFTSQGKVAETKAEGAKPAEANASTQAPSKELPKPQLPPVDPIQVWSGQLDQVRARIRALQDQEMGLLLQQNQITNQVYAPLTDPETQERAQAQLAQNQQQLAALRAELDEAKKAFDALQTQGPPKK